MPNVGWGWAHGDRVAHYYMDEPFYPRSACYTRMGTRGHIAPSRDEDDYRCKTCQRSKRSKRARRR